MASPSAFSVPAVAPIGSIPVPSPCPHGSRDIGSLAAPLSRRVGAGLVDLVWVLLPTVVVVRSTGGATMVSHLSSSPSTSHLEAMGQAHPWRFTLALADNTISLSGAAFAVATLTMALTTVLAMIVVPLIDEGRTPGMALFHLRIVGVDRRRPTPWALAVRTLAAPLDIMPVVVPGLVGFAFAASNDRRQRIGDRLAGTTVVHEPATPGAEHGWAKPIRWFGGSGAKTGIVTRSLNPSRSRPDLPVNTEVRPSPGVAGLAVASSGRALGGPRTMTNHSADATIRPAPVEPIPDRPPVAERPRFNPYPKPQRPAQPQTDEQRPPEERRQLDFAAASKAAEVALEDRASERSSPQPEWNEEWRSWVYWDHGRRQWLRFDSESAEWKPMVRA